MRIKWIGGLVHNGGRWYGYLKIDFEGNIQLNRNLWDLEFSEDSEEDMDRTHIMKCSALRRSTELERYWEARGLMNVYN